MKAKASSTPSGNRPLESTASSTATAGWELDALVAEKVMGWTDIQWHGQRGYATGIHPAYPPLGRMSVSRYSSGLVAAWEIVEKLSPGLDFYLRFVSQWTAEFVTIGGGDSESADADTAPLAICLAALKAVGT